MHGSHINYDRGGLTICERNKNGPRNINRALSAKKRLILNTACYSYSIISIFSLYFCYFVEWEIWFITYSRLPFTQHIFLWLSFVYFLYIIPTVSYKYSNISDCRTLFQLASGQLLIWLFAVFHLIYIALEPTA